MEIRINGQKAYVTIDNEKTIGEVMAGMDEWLANSGHRLSGLSIDGQAADASSLEAFFSKAVDKVKEIDIFTSSLAELTSQTMLNLIGDIEEYEGLNFDEKSKFCENWKNRAQARFAAEQLPDVFELYANTFSGGSLSPAMLRSITEEWLREVEDPAGEFTRINPLLDEICSRLVDLPLDVQTGKDARAAETIGIFSGIAEKIIRIERQLIIQGLLREAGNNEKPVAQLINEFGGAVKELLEAYERRDSVLVGDLAEYEIAPKLRELYAAIENNNRE